LLASRSFVLLHSFTLPFAQFLHASGLGKLAVRLKSMGISNMAELINVGVDEIGAQCKLKVPYLP
jgi:hypothetical protein